MCAADARARAAVTAGAVGLSRQATAARASRGPRLTCNPRGGLPDSGQAGKQHVIESHAVALQLR